MSGANGNVALVAHIPGLSIESDAVPFLYSNSELQKLTFEQYAHLTAADQRREREFLDAKPVFYIAEIAADLDTAPPSSRLSALQIKAPSSNRNFEGPVAAFQHFFELGVMAWKCLSLALPMTGLISPRHSFVCFAAKEPHYFFFQGRPVSSLQLQGDANHEYIFALRFGTPAASQSQLLFAERQKELVEIIEADPALKGAFEGLLQSQHLALSRIEHAVLCIVQLEELLLGETTLNLRREFTRRAY
jgi:hypothetical protein